MGEATRQTLEPITLSLPWTSEEEAGLRAMVQLGKRAAVIAKQLGRTEEAVRNRVVQLGISLRRESSIAESEGRGVD
jgi:hypothetical protein